MNKTFEEIARIQGMIAAAFVTDDGKLAGWCANGPMTPENLNFIAENCRVILSANRAEQRAATLGAVAFGDRTLVFREGASGIFIAWLDSPTNEAVIAWLFTQVDPLLAAAGVRF